MSEAPPIGYHVTCRLRDSRVIAPTHEDRKLVARIVLDKFRGRRLLAFNVPDTHLHLQHLEPLDVGKELTWRVLLAISRRLRIPVGFDRPFPKPMRTQAHLFRTFDYIHSQQPHHGLEWDPYHEASNLPDLLGLRVLGQWTANCVRDNLPRVKRRLLLGYLGIEEPREADGPLEAIVPATLAASGLPGLTRRDRETLLARRAALAVMGDRIMREQVARLLGVDRKTIHRCRKLPVDERLVRAIRLQLDLRARVPAAPTGPFVPRPRP